MAGVGIQLITFSQTWMFQFQYFEFQGISNNVLKVSNEFFKLIKYG